jgi:hypothetical protein
LSGYTRPCRHADYPRFGAAPHSARAGGAPRRGRARMVVLVGVTGFIVAAVVASICAPAS